MSACAHIRMTVLIALYTCMPRLYVYLYLGYICVHGANHFKTYWYYNLNADTSLADKQRHIDDLTRQLDGEDEMYLKWSWCACVCVSVRE